MKTNPPLLVASLSLLTLLPVSAGAGFSPDGVTAADPFEAGGFPFELSPYAPAGPAFDWPEAGRGGRDLLSGFEVIAHPSLAADLTAGHLGTPALDEDDERWVGEAELAIRAPLGFEPERRGAERGLAGGPPALELNLPAAGDGPGPVYEIRAVPHPLLAGLAALLGLALTVGGRERFV